MSCHIAARSSLCEWLVSGKSAHKALSPKTHSLGKPIATHPELAAQHEAFSV